MNGTADDMYKIVGADESVQCIMDVPLKNKRYHQAMNALFEKLDLNQELCLKQLIYETIVSVITMKDYPVCIDLDWVNRELSNGGALFITNEEQALIRGLVSQVMICKQKLLKAQCPVKNPTFADILLQYKVNKRAQLDMVNASVKKSIMLLSDSTESIEHRESAGGCLGPSSAEGVADGDSSDKGDTRRSTQNTSSINNISIITSLEADRSGDGVVGTDLTPAINGGAPAGDKPLSPNTAKELISRLPRIQTLVPLACKRPLKLSLLQLFGGCPPNSPSGSTTFTISHPSTTAGINAFWPRSSSPASNRDFKPDLPMEYVPPSSRVVSSPRAPTSAQAASPPKAPISARGASPPKAPLSARGATVSKMPTSARGATVFKVPTSARGATASKMPTSARGATASKMPTSARGATVSKMPTSSRAHSTPHGHACPPKSSYADKTAQERNTQTNPNGIKGNSARPRLFKGSDIPRYTRKVTSKNASSSMTYKEPTAVPPGSLASVITSASRSPNRLQRPFGSRIPAMTAWPRQPPKALKSSELGKPKPKQPISSVFGKYYRQFHN